MTGHTASAVGSRDEGEFSSLCFFVHPGTQSMGLSHLPPQSSHLSEIFLETPLGTPRGIFRLVLNPVKLIEDEPLPLVSRNCCLVCFTSRLCCFRQRIESGHHPGLSQEQQPEPDV